MIPKLLSRTYTIMHRIVFPPKCLVCNRFFQPAKYTATTVAKDSDHCTEATSLSVQARLDGLLSAFLCHVCIRGLITVASPICDCCGLPFNSRQGADHRCHDCIAEPKFFRIARAPLVYEPILTQVVHCFKYRGKVQLANPLAEILLTSFRQFWQPESIDMILPVPLHNRRFRRRGFNQAFLLVRNWKYLAQQYLLNTADLRIETDILVRIAATAPQTALGRDQRAVNIKNAFDLTRPNRVKKKRILLIDDVYTTGATVNECARLLLDSGARQVDILTLARAV